MTEYEHRRTEAPDGDPVDVPDDAIAVTTTTRWDATDLTEYVVAEYLVPADRPEDVDDPFEGEREDGGRWLTLRVGPADELSVRIADAVERHREQMDNHRIRRVRASIVEPAEVEYHLPDSPALLVDVAEAVEDVGHDDLPSEHGGVSVRSLSLHAEDVGAVKVCVAPPDGGWTEPRTDNGGDGS